MKITFILPVLDLSGGNRVVAIHARGLAARGHQVVIVVARPRPLSWKHRLRRGELFPQRAPTLDEMKSRSHFADSSVDLRLAAGAGEVTAQDVPDADVVVATWWETAEWVLKLPRAKGAKVSFVQHHEVFEYLPLDRVRATYAAPLHRIAIAQWLVDTLAVEYGDNDVDLVPNAVDHELFFASRRNRQSRPTVGFLYSTTPFKGLETTVSAVRQLLVSFPDLRVLSFGQSESAVLDGLGGHVEYTASPPQARIREIYASCDVWLTASTSEGFNLPAMEAMACRTPVVSTRTGWPAEAIRDGANGFLVAVGDVDALCANAKRVLTLRNEEWQVMSDGAYQSTASCNWQSSTRLFEESLARARVKAGRAVI